MKADQKLLFEETHLMMLFANDNHFVQASLYWTYADALNLTSRSLSKS